MLIKKKFFQWLKISTVKRRTQIFFFSESLESSENPESLFKWILSSDNTRKNPDYKLGESVFLNTNSGSVFPKLLLSEAIHFSGSKETQLQCQSSRKRKESEQLGVLYSLDLISAAHSSDIDFFFSLYFFFCSIQFLFFLFYDQPKLVLASFLVPEISSVTVVISNARKCKCYDFKRQRMAMEFFCLFFSVSTVPPDVKNWLIGKDPDARKDWRQEEKGTTESEMVGWHHALEGHESE